MIDYHALGIAVGIIFAFVVFSIVYAIGKKKQSVKAGKYDERQVAARGQSYKYGFFAMMIYNVVYALIDLCGIVWCDTYTGLFLGLLVGIGVFAVTAIHKDAYLALNENLKSWITMGVCVFAATLLSGIANLGLGNRFLKDGKLGVNSIQLFVCLLWAVILVTQLVHNRRRGADEPDEDEA